MIPSSRGLIGIAVAIITASVLSGALAARDWDQAGLTSVGGRVLSTDETPRPVPGATVTVLSADGLSLGSALTDVTGIFMVRGIPPGAVRIKAAKAAYLGVEYGARGPGRRGVAVPLDSGSTANVVLHLPRGAVVAGTVYDAFGNPFPGMPVQILRRRGHELVTAATDLDVRARTTDAEGRYRLYGLDAGEYIVGATPGIMGAGVEGRAVTDEEVRWARQLAAGGSRLIASPEAAPRISPHGHGRLVYASGYHPASLAADDARGVVLNQGDVRTGVDIRMQLQPASSLTGRTVGPDGTPVVARVTLFPEAAYAPDDAQGMLYTITSASSRGGVVGVRSGADGEFAITSLTPGTYRIAARAEAKDGPGPLWAMTRIRVADEDLDDVVVTLSPGGSVAGRIVAAGQDHEPPGDVLSGLRIDLVAEDDSIGAATLRALPVDGATAAFEATSIAPGRYRLQVEGVAQGWLASRAIAGETDLLDTPIDITAADRLAVTIVLSPGAASIGGRFSDATGQSVADYYVIVFPDEASAWLPRARRIRIARPDVTGRFEIPGLPAGAYRVAATWDVEPDEWFDATFLAALRPASIPVSLAEGERLVQDIRVGSGGGRLR
ncbi:MAG: carboxypeptidase-like regulatory domain-containing protein [Vicinamibacterales bacterium]